MLSKRATAGVGSQGPQISSLTGGQIFLLPVPRVRVVFLNLLHQIPQALCSSVSSGLTCKTFAQTGNSTPRGLILCIVAGVQKRIARFVTTLAPLIDSYLVAAVAAAELFPNTDHRSVMCASLHEKRLAVAAMLLRRKK